MIVTKDYNLSWNEKATLRQDLQSWRGKAFTEDEQKRFDIKSILDKWCMLNIVHKPKKNGSGVYANVKGITPVASFHKNKLPKGHNQHGIFMISEPDMEMFETFGKYLKEMIQRSPEWKAVQGRKAEPAGAFDDMEDDRPF